MSARITFTTTTRRRLQSRREGRIKPALTEYQKKTLSSGLVFVGERYPHVRSVSIGVWVKTGSRHEPKSVNGISHCIEHMVFKGTEKRSHQEIATVIESLGGELNAFTDREMTCFHATVLAEHLVVALDVLSDLVIRPLFDKEQLEKERRVLLQELAMVQETPDDRIGDLFFESVWPDCTLGRPVIGTRESLKAMSRSVLRSYFQEHYRPERMVLSIAGNFDFDSAVAVAEEYFCFPKRKSGPTQMAVKPAQYRAAKKSVQAETEQVHLLLGFESVGIQDPRRFEALVLGFFLGGGMSSRLFQEVREKAGLAYTIDCDSLPFSDAGVITIYSALRPRSVEKCLSIVKREIERLKKEPLPGHLLEQVKGQLRGTILLSSDQMEARQESLARNEIAFGRYVPLDEIILEIERVTSESVRAVAQELFVPEKEAVVTLGKWKLPRGFYLLG